MPEKVPFQTVTRGAAQRALREAELAQAAAANANANANANVQTATVTAPAQQSVATPQGEGAPDPAQMGNLNTPRRRLTRNTPARGSTTTRSRRSALVLLGHRQRQRAHARSQASDRQHGANEGADVAPHPTEGDSAEGPNAPEPGSSILNNSFRADIEHANENQTQTQPLQNRREQGRFPAGDNPWFSADEELTPLLQPGNEAGEMMEWMEETAREPTPDRDLLYVDWGTIPPLRVEPSTIAHDRIFMDRCTSPSCPVPSTIPHERGVYIHGPLSPQMENPPWGLSNPPWAVWHMLQRVRNGAALQGDRETVDAFVRNHGFMLPENPSGRRN